MIRFSFLMHEISLQRISARFFSDFSHLFWQIRNLVLIVFNLSIEVSVPCILLSLSGTTKWNAPSPVLFFHLRGGKLIPIRTWISLCVRNSRINLKRRVYSEAFYYYLKSLCLVIFKAFSKSWNTPAVWYLFEVGLLVNSILESYGAVFSILPWHNLIKVLSEGDWPLNVIIKWFEIGH